ncbi:endonuclease/exonuclease/phosphatase family protein [Nocardia callitridis]|uniref:Endonuclease/exonuclease/phosphatase family protein n=1 Tax=Nocardia callitridis TaxID=648753 RepID=A0ABP9K2R5_9NOCA
MLGFTVISKVIGIGFGVLGCAAALTGVALHFHRFSAQLLVLAASGAPYLMVGALVGAISFLVVGQRFGAGVAVVVLAVGAWTQAPLYTGQSGDDDGVAVTVMQSNLLFDGADPSALVEAVRARNVAVLTVNELTTTAVADLGRAGLTELLPYRYVSPGRTATGTGIWSRYRLTDTVEYDGYVLNQLSATAHIPGAGPVTIFAFHPVPPVYGAEVWADELSRLRAILEHAPEGRPAIAGGDFNATYDHHQFRALTSGRFADAVEQCGAGHVVTYPTDKWFPPLIGIDHILVAEGRATAVDTVRLAGADHRALTAHLLLDKRR